MKWPNHGVFFRLAAVFSVLLAACARQLVGEPATVTPAAAPTEADPRSAALNEIVNTVLARASEANPFAQVEVGFVLGEGGQLRTGADSSARLDFDDGSILRLGEHTSFTFLSATQAGGDPARSIRLELGKIWVNLTGGGALEVETPLGVASVRGSWAVFAFSLGDPDDPSDDLLVLDCLEGSCGVDSDAHVDRLGNLQRVVVTRAGGLRFTLTGADVQNFLQNNPEGQAIVATLTAAPPPTATPSSTPTLTFTPSPRPTATGTPLPAPTQTAAPTATETPVPTATPVPTTAVPPVPILGLHTVRAGETLFCIGRGYGVLPTAIAAVNGTTSIFVGQVLRIPAVRWVNIPPGPVCAPQINSPFPGLPTATSPAAVPPTSASSPTPQCTPPEFFDPFLNRCRLPDTPQATQTEASPPTISATAPPNSTPTVTAPASPTATKTKTETPTATTAPTATGMGTPGGTPVATSTASKTPTATSVPPSPTPGGTGYPSPNPYP